MVGAPNQYFPPWIYHVLLVDDQDTDRNMEDKSIYHDLLVVNQETERDLHDTSIHVVLFVD